MKKILSYIFVFFALVSFIFSSAGFSIHRCSCEGRTEIKLMADPSLTIFSDSCEKGEHEHAGCAHDHKDGCCETEYLILEEYVDAKIMHVHNIAPQELPVFTAELPVVANVCPVPDSANGIETFLVDDQSHPQDEVYILFRKLRV